MRRLEHCHRRESATLIQVKKAKLSQPRQNGTRLYERNLYKSKMRSDAGPACARTLQPFIFMGRPAATKETSAAMAAIR